eukprot:sb/3465819/
MTPPQTKMVINGGGSLGYEITPLRALARVTSLPRVSHTLYSPRLSTVDLLIFSGKYRTQWNWPLSQRYPQLNLKRTKHIVRTTVGPRFTGILGGEETYEAYVKTNQNSLFRSSGWLSANQGPAFPNSHVRSFTEIGGGECSYRLYYVEPTETSKELIRTRYLGHVTGYQPIKDQYFLIRSVPVPIRHIHLILSRVTEISGPLPQEVHRVFSKGHCAGLLIDSILIYLPTETSKQPIRTRYLGHVTGYQPIRDQYFLIRSIDSILIYLPTETSKQPIRTRYLGHYLGHVTGYQPIRDQYFLFRSIDSILIYLPTETSKQPIRTRYLGHVTGYQPIRDQYFLFRSISSSELELAENVPSLTVELDVPKSVLK